MAPTRNVRGRALLMCAVLFAAGCSGTIASPTPTADATPTSASSPTTFVSPTATTTTNPASFVGDSRMKACGGLEAGVDAVVPLDHAWAYRMVMPGIGFMPQLDASADPALIVVYSGAVPADLDWRTYLDHVPGPRLATPAPTPAPPTSAPTMPPGIRNVCVAFNGTDRLFIVPNVPITSFHPELASLTTRPAVTPGQARVLTRTAAWTYGLAWDQMHGALWYVVESQTDTALYRLDPATGKTARWALPTTDANGFMDMVVVDATGAVWFDQGGIRLYRLDPNTGSLAHLDINTRIKPVVDEGGVWISGIAADGDGVLIARESLPYLTRIDATLHEAGKIQLADNYTGATEVAVVGDDVAVAGKPDEFALFSRRGARLGMLPLQRWGSLLGGPTRLFEAGKGRAAVAQSDGLAIFDATGKTVGTVPVRLDLPIGPFGDLGGFESTPQSQSFATDWNGTFWYALGSYIVEVRAS